MAALAALCCVLAQAPIHTELVPLHRTDPVLQSALGEALRQRGLGDALDRRALAVAVVDLSHPGEHCYAGINDDHMMYAASLPKIGILLGVIQGIADGRLRWGPDYGYRLGKMITVSSNPFATWGYNQAGVQHIAEVVQRPHYRFYSAPHGGLWVGRPFGGAGPTRRDPIKGLSHAASARQTARFYTLLHARRLVSPYWSERMEDLMGPPELHHKLVGAIGERPGVRFVARKSGSWRSFHADSALVEHYGRPYVVAVLADSWEGEAMVRTVGQVVDDLILTGPHRGLSAPW